ncbi:MAG: ribosome silencing factor [Epsilonproteobacteria bacterium]|nr:MAG: ribosome silencing factor [Campylobacterota bacterium]
MSNEFIQKEVNKIYGEFEFPKNMAMASAWILGNLKASNLKVLDVKKTSGLVDYFVLASAGNPIQAQSMAEEVAFQAKRLKQKILSIEGRGGSDWILLDLGDIIVHIFIESVRDIYDLDQLYGEAPIVEIPNEYYFSTPEDESEEEGYF